MHKKNPVSFGAGQSALMLSIWEGNHRSSMEQANIILVVYQSVGFIARGGVHEHSSCVLQAYSTVDYFINNTTSSLS